MYSRYNQKIGEIKYEDQYMFLTVQTPSETLDSIILSYLSVQIILIIIIKCI